MILTREEILKLIQEKKLIVQPFDDEVVRENGLDLRIGNEYAIYSFSDQVIDLTRIEDTKEIFSKVEAKDGKISIPPGNFVLLSTLEYLKLPENIAAICNLRSTLARFGLVIPPTVIDAGFEGNLTIEVVNATKNYLVLKPGIRFLHVVLFDCKGKAKYSGKYLGQKGVTLPKSLKNEINR